MESDINFTVPNTSILLAHVWRMPPCSSMM